MGQSFYGTFRSTISYRWCVFNLSSAAENNGFQWTYTRIRIHTCAYIYYIIYILYTGSWSKSRRPRRPWPSAHRTLISRTDNGPAEGILVTQLAHFQKMIRCVSMSLQFRLIFRQLIRCGDSGGGSPSGEKYYSELIFKNISSSLFAFLGWWWWWRCAYVVVICIRYWKFRPALLS